MSRGVEERYHVKYLLPGWVGGGLFMQYLTGIFLGERHSLAGRSAANFAYANMRHADEKALPAWGWSSCADPDGGYIGWGKLRDEVVTPHAVTYLDWIWPAEINDAFCQGIPALVSGTITSEQACGLVQDAYDTIVQEDNYIYQWWNNFTEEESKLVYPG